MPINAPYNFVPLSKHVYLPDWADEISHDVPFKDGLSGTIELKITARTPLSIGGDRGNNNTLKFFQLPSGSYAIPGSSLRGMIRSVFEIATFSKMQLVDNNTFGLRDLNGDHVKELYRKAIKGKQKAGYLQLINGKPTIKPCEFAYISHKELINILNLQQGDLFPHEVKIKNNKVKQYDLFSPQKGKQKNLSDKYAYWNKLCKNKKITISNKFTGKVSGKEYSEDKELSEVKFDSNGDYQLVLTGQVNWLKRRDFVFYEKNEKPLINIKKTDPLAWGDFLSIHGDDDKSTQAETRPWNGYWRNKFFAGEEVPIFYIHDESEKRLRFSLAYMMKLAGDYHVHDLIGHSSKNHLDKKLDLTEAVFGKANDENSNESLKGRVYFELAKTSETNIDITAPMVLASPKASYFPNYIKQSSENLQGETQYNTYLKHGSKKPEIRGWKRYPVATQEGHAADGTDAVSVCLSTLPEGTTFSSRIIFHNLKPIELGALLWALQIENGLHSIGTGKAFGYGQVSLESELDVIPNQTKDKPWSKEALIENYIKRIDKKISDWRESPQIESLIAMTRYQKPEDINFKGSLRHMTLDIRDSRKNQFVNAKGEGSSLAEYIKVNTRLELEEETLVWKEALIFQAGGNPKVTATKKDGEVAILNNGDELIKSLGLSKKNQMKKLRKGILKLNASIAIRGNIKTIISLEKLPQP